MNNKLNNIFNTFVLYCKSQLYNFPLLFDHPAILRMAFTKQQFYKTKKQKEAILAELFKAEFGDIPPEKKTAWQEDYKRIVSSLRFVLIFLSLLLFVYMLIFPLDNKFSFTFFIFCFLLLFVLSNLYISAFNINNYLSKIS